MKWQTCFTEWKQDLFSLSPPFAQFSVRFSLVYIAKKKLPPPLKKQIFIDRSLKIFFNIYTTVGGIFQEQYFRKFAICVTKKTAILTFPLKKYILVFLCAVFFQSSFASSKVFFESVLSYLVLAQSNNLGVNGRPCQWEDELLDEFGNC